ncbi:MAG: DUF1836 domain-containing protein [Tissierellia bacterium]|nr:DUF1836 domain-containing protein [Tissierellia bacterium]
MLPLWEELPEGPMTNRELVDHVRTYLAPLFRSEDFITTTRIQNYVKWGVLMPPQGRRYFRIHLVEAMILSILKGVLTTEEIARGIRLQLLQLSTQEAYEAFRGAFLDAREEVENLVKEGIIRERPINYPALSAVCRAFCYESLTRDIIEIGGFDLYKGEKNE